MPTIDFPKVFKTVLGIILIIGAVRGFRRREFRRRRHWGQIGGPKELPPISGNEAVAWSVWLVALGLGLIFWAWGV